MSETRHRVDTDKCFVEGAEAEPGTPCPYGQGDLRQRCAWLATHADTHGYQAAEQAAEHGSEKTVAKKWLDF